MAVDLHNLVIVSSYTDPVSRGLFISTQSISSVPEFFRPIHRLIKSFVPRLRCAHSVHFLHFTKLQTHSTRLTHFADADAAKTCLSSCGVARM